jgi:hypothetical protein
MRKSGGLVDTLEPRNGNGAHHAVSPLKLNALKRAERGAIEEHRIAMEARLSGGTVTFEEAEADWTAHHAVAWRQAWHRKCMEAQKAEILRHKWIESEKARQDLGNQAVVDWIEKYAGQWRAWYEETLA